MDHTVSDSRSLLSRIEQFAEKHLRPVALLTDRSGVLPATVDRLAGLGALNHLAPAEYGGAALSRDDDRRLHEILAGACFNTWLVWAQHAPLVGRLAAVSTPGPLAQRALRGEVLLGAGISDVRRFPARYIAATRTPGGWVFDGTISWVSGWGLNEALTVAAVEAATGTVVTALVPVGPRTVGTPLQLSAVGGSRTERVRLDRVEVPDENVIGTQSLDEWRHADFGVASDARPHHFGLAATVLRELSAQPAAQRVAEAWAPRVGQLRTAAYRLADEATEAGGGAYRLDERLALKVAIGDTLATLTRALVVARSGHAVATDDTAQLHARSAMFALVQGQSAAVREAQLASLEAAVPAAVKDQRGDLRVGVQVVHP